MTQSPAIPERLRDELTDLTVSLCRALADPKRLLVLYLLRDGARTVGELSDAIGARQANTSQHLAVLRERGLVETTRQGTSILYSLRHPSILDAIDVLRGIHQEEARLRGTGRRGDRGN